MTLKRWPRRKGALKNVPGKGDGLERSIHGQGSGRWWGQWQDAPEKIFSVLGLFNSFLHPCCCCYWWSSSVNNCLQSSHHNVYRHPQHAVQKWLWFHNLLIGIFLWHSLKWWTMPKMNMRGKVANQWRKQRDKYERGGNKHGKIEMNLHTSMTGGVSYISLNELNCKSHFRKPWKGRFQQNATFGAL